MRLTIPGRQPRRIPPGPMPDTPDEYQPRDHAIRYLRDKIRVGEAGLDQYDPSIFVLYAGDHERVWAHTMLNLVGVVESVVDGWDGRRRFKVILEADVRVELGVDHASPMGEPLASRGVDAAGIVMDEVLRVLPTVPVRLLEAEREPVSFRAMRAAKRAFDAAHREEGDSA